MENQGMDRRSFLKMAAATGVMVSATSVLPKFSWAGVKPVRLEKCMQMSPEEMAESSKLVIDSWDYIIQIAQTIKDDAIRTTVKEILQNPAPTFMTPLMEETNKKEAYASQKSQGFIEEEVTFEKFLPFINDPAKAPHPFIAGPGSGYTSHHSYPGGLVSHTALNTAMSLSLYSNYESIYGCSLNRDIVIASQVLHDLHKPWVFQWQADGRSRRELQLAGTGEHHTYGVAESIYRGLPVELCVAQACAHNHPGWAKDESGPVNWLTSAAGLVGKDPVAAGLLAPDGKTLPLPRRMENFVCHLGDHDWVLSVPAAKWLIPVIEDIATQEYGMSKHDLQGKKFNQFRNYLFSQSSIMNLYQLYASRGQAELTSYVTSMVTT